MKNPLLPLPKPEQPLSVPDIYRQLGAVFLLDCYMKGEPFKQTFEDYYPELLKHFQEGTVFLSMDEEKKPQAYVTWEVEGDDKVVLNKQIAPFGDHLSLNKQLQHFFKGKEVYASTPRSICEVQRAYAPT